jgi:hypothetical protein
VGRSRCILQRSGQRWEVLRAIWSSADTYAYSNCVTYCVSYSDIHCYSDSNTDWYSNGNTNTELNAASYSDAEISSKPAITPDSPASHNTSTASAFATSYSSAATLVRRITVLLSQVSSGAIIR